MYQWHIPYFDAYLNIELLNSNVGTISGGPCNTVEERLEMAFEIAFTPLTG